MGTLRSTKPYDALSNLFVTLAQSSDDIDGLLKNVADYYDADRAYIFQITADGKAVDNTYEWCREGVSKEIDNLQNVPIESVALWIQEFEKSGAFYISKLDTDVERSSLTYEYLEPQGIDSLITAPLYEGGKISGFIGVDNPRTNHDELLILKSAASIIHNDIRRLVSERREKQEQVNRQNSLFSKAFLDTFESAYYVDIENNTVTILRQKDFLHEEYSYQRDWVEMITKYVDEGINQEDRGKFDIVCDLNLLRKRIESQTESQVIYRDTSIGYERYCKLYVIRGENLSHAYIGFMDVDAVMKERLESQSVIASLADAYISLYLVNLNSGKFTTLKRSETLSDRYRAETGQFETAIAVWINQEVLPEDRAKALEACNFEYIRRQFETKRTYSVSIRYNQPELRYREMRITRSGDYDQSSNFFLSFIDNHEHIIAQERADAQARQLEVQSVISSMAEDFDFIAAVNEKDKTVTRFWTSDKFRNVAKQIDPSLPSNERLDRMLRLIVHPDDMDFFMQKTDYDTCRVELEKRRNYKFEFRTLIDGKEEYYRIKFADKPDEPDTVILGLLNINKQVRHEMEIATMREREKKEAQLVRALETEKLFRNVLIESANGFLQANLSKNKIEGEIIDIASDGGRIVLDPVSLYGNIGYDEFEQWWANNGLLSDPEEFLKISNCDYLISRFNEGERKVSLSCTSKYESEKPRISRQDYFLYRDPISEDICTFCIVWDITAEVEKEKKLSEAKYQAEQNSKVIDAFVREYTSAYRVNIKTGEYVTLRSMIGVPETLRVSPDIKENIRFITNNLIIKSDRKYMAEELSLETIARRLEETPIYSREFRCVVNPIKLEGGGWTYDRARLDYNATDDHLALWHRVTFSKIDENEILIGFVEDDSNILLKEANRVIMDDLDALYAINVAVDKMKIIKASGMLQGAPEIVPYRATMKQFCSGLDEEAKAFFMQFETEQGYHNLIKAGGRVEYLYRTPYYAKMNVWLKASVHALTGRDGKLETAILGISYVDNQQKEIIEMNDRLAEQQKQLEKALSMAESASRAKTTFLNSMSHDIRTPMNAIIGYTGLAETHIDNKAQVQDYLKKIGQSSDHLLSLINDVLDMSRIEAGKVSLEEKPESISDIVLALCNIMNADIQSKELEFVKTIEVTDDIVVCDRLRLNQVLLNILSNAIKYTPSGGIVSFEVSQKKTSEGYGEYGFRVKDNGMGMSQAFLDTIFEPFTRAKTSTISGIQGTGLGMAITKKIVDMMGGNIEIKSKENEGTDVNLTFRFKLEESEIVPNEKEDKAYDFHGRNVLLVEDNDMNLEIARMLLEENGFSVSIARDGTEAVEIMSSAQPSDFNLILMDIQMPVMNGREATKRIRELPGPVSKIPIIAMSADAFDEDRRAAFDAGMNDYVNKPVDVRQLLDTIQKNLF